MRFAESKPQLTEDASMPMHRPALRVRGVEPGTQPFEITRFPPVHIDLQIRLGWFTPSMLGRLLDRPRQGVRRLLAKRRVNFGQVLAVQLVKFPVVRRAMFRPVPPIPI